MARTSYTTYSPETLEQLCEFLSYNPNVNAALKQVKMNPNTWCHWRRNDVEFLERTNDALEMGVQAMKDIAWDRASKGSDTLMIFLLKTHDPVVRAIEDKNSFGNVINNPSPVYVSVVLDTSDILEEKTGATDDEK
jgi:hypothetical protein